MVLIIVILLLISNCSGNNLSNEFNKSFFLTEEYQTKILKGINFPINRSTYIPERFYFGVGDRLYAKTEKRIVYLPSYVKDHGLQINAFALWITKDFQVDWFSEYDLSRLKAQGITPVLIFYYFGDEISVENILLKWNNYYNWLLRVSSFLKTDMKLLIVFEPEFNIVPENGLTPVTSWEGYNDFIIATVKVFRKYFPNAKIGLCPGDFRTYNLKKSIGRAALYLDFIAFQELWAKTRKNNLSENYEDVSDYALLFTSYLSSTFKKPVLLAYLGVSSYNGNGNGDDWEVIQADVIRNIKTNITKFINSGLFGFLYFEAVDDPEHEGYFKLAEKHFGLINEDGKLKNGFWEMVSFYKKLKKLLGKNLSLKNFYPFLKFQKKVFNSPDKNNTQHLNQLKGLNY